MSSAQPDPFEGLELDDDFIRAATIHECDLEWHRERMNDAAFWCPECTRRQRRRQRRHMRAGGAGAVVMTLGAVSACMGSAAFASLAACGIL